MYNYVRKTRAWKSSAVETIIHFRTDKTPFIYIYTPVGWSPVGNCPNNPEKAEKMAEDLAKGYNLIEVEQKEAKRMAGWKY